MLATGAGSLRARGCKRVPHLPYRWARFPCCFCIFRMRAPPEIVLFRRRPCYLNSFAAGGVLSEFHGYHGIPITPAGPEKNLGNMAGGQKADHPHFAYMGGVYGVLTILRAHKVRARKCCAQICMRKFACANSRAPIRARKCVQPPKAAAGGCWRGERERADQGALRRAGSVHIAGGLARCRGHGVHRTAKTTAEAPGKCRRLGSAAFRGHGWSRGAAERARSRGWAGFGGRVNWSYVNPV